MLQIIKFVMASAAEAELAALYNTTREMVPLRNALEEMGWKQPKSPHPNRQFYRHGIHQ